MSKSLQDLYPFLHGVSKDPEQEKQALLESISQKHRDSISCKEQFFSTQSGALLLVAKALANSLDAGGKLLTMGNGGSHCDASHLAVEFQHPVTTGRPAFPAIDLASDITMLTAVGNDVGFDQVYVRRLTAMANNKDILVGISTSGNSKNLLLAFEYAKSIGMLTIGLSGMNGGDMAKSKAIDHCLIVPSDSIHRIQECQVTIYHILWDLVHTILADTRGGLMS
jgi:D-sedoheptulose 7-phosphate isomerase